MKRVMKQSIDPMLVPGSLLACAFIGACLPAGLYFYFCINYSTNMSKRFTSLITVFTSGIMFALAITEFIPEANHMSRKLRGHSAWNQPYLYVVIGYLVMLLLEKVILGEHHTHSHNAHHTHSHNNHEEKHKEKKDVESKAKLSIGSGIVMLAAFAIHSIMEGAAMITIKDQTQFLFSLVGILGHQLSDSFAIAIMVKKMWPNCSKAKMFGLVFTVKLATLMGYALGKTMLPQTGIIQVALMGFVAGMFIYVSTTDVIPEEMEGKRGEVAYKYLIYVAGIVLMVASHFLGHTHKH